MNFNLELCNSRRLISSFYHDFEWLCDEARSFYVSFHEIQMFFSRSQVLRMNNCLNFLIILPFLFEEFEELIRMNEEFTLLFASLRIFGICVIFLDHSNLIIILKRHSVKICISRVVRIDSKRRSDVGTTSKNQIHFIEGSLRYWNLKLGQQQRWSLPF